MCVYAQYIVNTENIEIVQADRRIQADGTVEKRKHCADTGVYLLNSMFTSRARALSQLVARARARARVRSVANTEVVRSRSVWSDESLHHQVGKELRPFCARVLRL